MTRKKNTHLKTGIQIKDLKILQNLHQSSQNPGRSFNVVNTGFHFSLAAGVCFGNTAKDCQLLLQDYIISSFVSVVVVVLV